MESSVDEPCSTRVGSGRSACGKDEGTSFSTFRRGCSAKGSPPMRIAMSVRAKTASTSSDGSSHEIKLSERRASRDREKMGGMLDGGVGSGGVREEEGTAERPESREAQENKGLCVCVCVV